MSETIKNKLSSENIALMQAHYLETSRFSAVSALFRGASRPTLLDIQFVIERTQIGGAFDFILKSFNEFKARRGLDAPVRFVVCADFPGAFCMEIGNGEYLIGIDIVTVYMLSVLAGHLCRFSAFRRLVEDGRPLPPIEGELPAEQGNYWTLSAVKPDAADLFNFQVLRDVGLWSMIRHELTHVAHGHLGFKRIIRDGGDMEAADQSDIGLTLEMDADAGSIGAAFEHLRSFERGSDGKIKFHRINVLTIGGVWLSFKTLEILSAGRERAAAGSHPSIGERQMMALSLIGQHLATRFQADGETIACGVAIAMEIERHLKLIGGDVTTVKDIFSEFNLYNKEHKRRNEIYAKIYDRLHAFKVQAADLPVPQHNRPFDWKE